MRLLLLALLLGAGAARAERPRGLIVISLDTLRADRLGAYGGPATPAIDAFAAEGTLFENAFANATWTVPSHASMLTGLLPSRHGAGGPLPKSVESLRDPKTAPRALKADVATLAERLRERGYDTAGFHFGPTLDPLWGFGRGFAAYEAAALEPGTSSGTLREDGFRRAASWLAAHDARRPYFLFIHSFAVHRYLFLDLAGPDSCPPRFDFARTLAGLDDPSDPRCAQTRARYDAAVRCADGEFGALMKALDGAGARDAVVMLVSDHGEALCDVHPGAPLVGHGYAPYEDQLRVPFILRLPEGRRAGRRERSDAMLVDLVPTALSALGEPAPAGLSGRDLLAPGPARPVRAEADDWSMARQGGLKYFRRADGREELYELAKDSGERADRSSDPAMKVRKAELRRLLMDGRPAKGAPAPRDERLREALRAEGYIR
jgi:choline-sulfatase